MNEPKIDLVVPYVDCSDPFWQETAKNNNISIDLNRFRGQGNFFKYFFRCIDKNLPWINNLFLIVQSESQIPTWLNRDKIKIVLHRDFIPEQFLPVYSSCTIEMFIQNIKELSEHFLYFNDDLFVLKHQTIDRFFDIDTNGVYQSFYSDIPIGLWGAHTKNSYKLIFTDENYLAMSHSIKVLLKSKMQDCFTLYKDKIYASISQIRNNYNFNIYLYSYYLKKLGLTKPSKVFNTLFFTNSYSLINSTFVDVICINDIEKENIYTNQELIKCFEKKFNLKSKYEQ